MMQYFTWTPDMSVGVERLDEDHKSLISIINHLAVSLEQDEVHDEATVDKALKALARYTEIHFIREEEVMKAVGYPQLPGHRGAHEAFIQELYTLKADYRAGDHDIRRNLLAFLKNWLTNHILVEDMDYRPYAESNSAANNAADCFEQLGNWPNR